MTAHPQRIKGLLGSAIKHGRIELVEGYRADLAVALIENEVERRLQDLPPLSADRAEHLHAVIEQFCSTSTTSDVLTA